MQATTPAEYEQILAADIAGFTHDPGGYIDYAFPWGRGELRDSAGPRAWQRAVLDDIGRRLKENAALNVWDAIQDATASGHGIGKSALVAMLVMWAMSTHEDTRGVVTANTDTQLRTKTWPEVAKWHRLAINSHWFELTATRMCSAQPGRSENWRIDIIPWSEHNTEAFSGLHNKGKRILLIFDEASAIHDRIWEVSDGALTDDNTEILFFCFGNPTRQNGRFRDCFGRLGHRWTHRHIDARTVEGTNLTQIAKMVEDNGEDSDIVRVRVRGEFPLQAEYQLIGQSHVAEARRRPVFEDRSQPIIGGLDFARSGSCETVLAFRTGRDARSWQWHTWRERDSVALAGKVAAVIHEMRRVGIHVNTIFADGGGLGGPIVDLLKHYNLPVIEVNNGTTATDSGAYANKGSEMWGRMRDWMATGAIPDDPELEQQLVSRDYKYDPKLNRLALVPKDRMIADGLPSPDRADALSLTFAYHVAPTYEAMLWGDSNKCLNDND